MEDALLVTDDEKAVIDSPLNYRFPKARRFSKRKEIQKVFENSQRRDTSMFRLYKSKTDSGQVGQFAVIISKRSGSAVVRNGCKRKVRNWIRIHMNNMNIDYHHIIYIKRNINMTKPGVIDDQLSRLMIPKALSNLTQKEIT